MGRRSPAAVNVARCATQVAAQARTTAPTWHHGLLARSARGGFTEFRRPVLGAECESTWQCAGPGGQTAVHLTLAIQLKGRFYCGLLAHQRRTVYLKGYLRMLLLILSGRMCAILSR